MRIGFYEWVFGYAEVTAVLKKPERMINELKSIHGVGNIKKNDSKTLSFTVVLSQMKKVKRVLSKLNADYEFSQKGFPTYVKRCRKRLGIPTALVFFAISIYISTLFVWDIRVTGNEKVTDEKITSALNVCGLYKGAMKKNIDVDRICNEFLINNAEISFIAVNMKGNIANVEIKERVMPPEIRDDSLANIIAKCDGIVLRADAIDGRREVENGDTVTKGQLLISSFYDTRKSGEILRSAKGTVIAQTVKKFSVYVPAKVTEKCYTGLTKERKSIIFFGYELPLYFDTDVDFFRYTADISENDAVLFGRFTLPFTVKTTVFHEFELKNTEISKDEAQKTAKNQKGKWYSDLSTDAQIISSSDTYLENEDGYVFGFETECIEDIGKRVPFTVG